MKKMSFLLILVGFIFVACSKKEDIKSNILDKPYTQIQNDAKNTEVSIYMWGGSKEVNNYIDSYVIPRIRDLYNITLNRVPIDNVKVILQKIELEKNAKRKSSTDIIWINGENFKIAKDKKLLYGSFVSKLPNYNKYIDTTNNSMLLDFAEPTQGLEAPFGSSQFVMVYDSTKVKNPPQNSDELFAWIKKNPSRFSYPALPDFTGSAFIRNLFINDIGGIENFDKTTYKNELLKFYAKLNDIKPYLFKKGTYLPNNSALQDTLYANGSVDFTFSYNPSHALNKIKTSNFPKTSKTLLFQNGSLANTHFLSIPSTSSNVEGAMVVINYLLSPEAQLEKAKSKIWGDGSVLDISKLDKEMQTKFMQLTSHESLIDTSILQNNQIPELNASYIEEIEKLWVKNVLKK